MEKTITITNGGENHTLFKHEKFVERLNRLDQEQAIYIFIDEWSCLKRMFPASFNSTVAKIMKDVNFLKMSEFDITDIIHTHNLIEKLKNELAMLERRNYYKAFNGSKCTCLCHYNNKKSDIQNEIIKFETILKGCKIF